MGTNCFIRAIETALRSASKQIYWNFGTIFELLAGSFSFAGLWLWTSERRAWPQVLFASLLLFFAMKSKEMAVAMPLAWFCYDLIVREKMDRKTFAHWMLPSALAFSYGLAKALTMKGSTPTHAYYMSINGSTLISGFGIYFNMLFRTNFSVQFWCTALLVFLCTSRFFRETASPCSSCCTFLSRFFPSFSSSIIDLRSIGIFLFWVFVAWRQY